MRLERLIICQREREREKEREREREKEREREREEKQQQKKCNQKLKEEQEKKRCFTNKRVRNPNNKRTEENSKKKRKKRGVGKTTPLSSAGVIHGTTCSLTCRTNMSNKAAIEELYRRLDTAKSQIDIALSFYQL